MGRVFLILGLVLLLYGISGAVAFTTAVGAGAAIAPQAFQQLLISMVLGVIGLVMTILALVLRQRGTPAIRSNSQP
jgi:membrane protein implicated in regulation of membrane protease activity